MTSRPVAIPVSLLFLAVGLSGCLGEPSPVYVPQSVVPDGWSHETENQTDDAAGGQVAMVVNHYVFQERIVGEVFLLGVTDVPFVDEEDILRKQLDAETQSAGVSVTRTGERTITLDNGQDANVVEYTITRQGATGEVRGEAWQLSWETGDFIGGGFGYATTEYDGLLGTERDDSQWMNVQRMMRAADW